MAGCGGVWVGWPCRVTISAVGRVHNAIVTSLNVVPPSTSIVHRSAILCTPDHARSPRTIINYRQRARTIIWFSTDSSGLHIVLQRRDAVLASWLIEIRSLWREQTPGDYGAHLVWSTDSRRHHAVRTKKFGRRGGRLKLWQCCERV